MKKVEAIIRPGKLDSVINMLDQKGIKGITVSQVIGCGNQKGHTEVYRGVEYQVFLLPKVNIEVVVPDAAVEDVIKTLSDAARTGEVGDGKIFVTEIEDAIRIRTGESGQEAL